MAFNAALAAQRRQATRARSTVARTSVASTDNITQMISTHRNKVAAQTTAIQLARSETLSQLTAKAESADLAAACALARSASHVILAEAEAASAGSSRIDWASASTESNDDFFVEPLEFPDVTYTFKDDGVVCTPTVPVQAEKCLGSVPHSELAQESTFLEAQELVSATDVGLVFVISDSDVSFEDEFERLSSGESDSEGNSSTADTSSASAHSRRGSSTSASSASSDDNLFTAQSSPDQSIELKQDGSSDVSPRSSGSLRRTQPWRSRRALVTLIESSLASPAAAAEQPIAQQQTTTQQPTQTLITSSTSAPIAISSRIDWSQDEADDSFLLESLVFPDCTYSFQSNGVARTPTGATEPDALLVAVPTAVRNHSRTFLKDVAYENAQTVSPTQKSRSTAARAGGSAARAAASDAAAAAQIAA